jgi:hypothetical protein
MKKMLTTQASQPEHECEIQRAFISKKLISTKNNAILTNTATVCLFQTQTMAALVNSSLSDSLSLKMSRLL